jgi:60 kDa SS-A/Ro ribonucleoprotein
LLTTSYVVLTDNETWFGSEHPCEALELYRAQMGIDARLVVVAMTGTKFTIADPNDPLCLDVVGFDTATPQLVADFAAGRI